MPPFSNSLKNEGINRIFQVNLNEYKSLVEFSNEFNLEKVFQHTGIMINGIVHMADYEPKRITPVTLEYLVNHNVENENLYLDFEKIQKFKQLKGGFQTTKISKTGFEYKYGMGKMEFPDPLNRPARTMVTTEHNVSRMTHVIEDPGNHKLRFITAEEAELINTFPEGWTKIEGVTESNRYFTMGNALVVDLVKEMGIEIHNIIEKEKHNISYKGNTLGLLYKVYHQD